MKRNDLDQVDLVLDLPIDDRPRATRAIVILAQVLAQHPPPELGIVPGDARPGSERRYGLAFEQR